MEGGFGPLGAGYVTFRNKYLILRRNFWMIFFFPSEMPPNFFTCVQIWSSLYVKRKLCPLSVCIFFENFAPS